MHVVPPIVLFLEKHEAVPRFDLSSVRTFFTAAAPVGVETMHKVVERLRLPALRFRQGTTSRSEILLREPRTRVLTLLV